MGYIEEIIDKVEKSAPQEKEFHQAVREVLGSLRGVIEENEEEYRKQALLERLVTPERVIMFRVPWLDRNQKVHVNTGYRVQFSSAIGPYKGGLRFHPSVNLSIIKFLAFEQTFKNSLTGIAMGGGKGGSDFDPKGKNDFEIMNFCQSFVNELYRHIGNRLDVPAGDIGVGAREIGYMFGQYKKLANSYEGVFTGKGLSYGGSLARKEATGYGLLYFVERLLKHYKDDLKGKRVVVSGAGNVAIYAIEKAQELGAKVLTASDSNGFIYDEEGIDLDILKDIKEVKKGRVKDYLKYRPKAHYYENEKIYKVKADIALPCATQNEIDLNDAKTIVANGYKMVCEGSNMSTELDAIEYLQKSGIIFGPAKACNAGGVATSGLEMSQNYAGISWSFEEVDKKLKDIMVRICETCLKAAKDNGQEGNLVVGANIAGFSKVAEAMQAQGIC